MPPEERRAAIIAATMPLLRQGAAVSTKEIAKAAGIAEGTIFRVFALKDDLMPAFVHKVLDTAAVRAALRAIDRALPLRTGSPPRW